MYRIATILAFALMAQAPAQAENASGVANAPIDLFTTPEAFAQLQAAAEQGDAEAQFQLAQVYRDGEGVAVDIARAENLLAKAAMQGHLEASDEYGILLFQSGRIAEAMSWIDASAERGEPRAQYYLGIARFNGDDVEKDWVRAYALMTRSAASGLAPAVATLNRMDAIIPLDQRRRGVLLAEELESTARESRARYLASTDLRAAPAWPADAPAARATAQTAAPTAAQAAPALREKAPQHVATQAPAASEQSAAPAPANAKKHSEGRWRIQLGAFGLKPNADGLWSRLRNHPALAGRKRFDVAAGPVSRLQAGPFGSNSEARRACQTLAPSHGQCVVVRP